MEFNNHDDSFEEAVQQENPASKGNEDMWQLNHSSHKTLQYHIQVKIFLFRVQMFILAFM